MAEKFHNTKVLASSINMVNIKTHKTWTEYQTIFIIYGSKKNSLSSEREEQSNLTTLLLTYLLRF